MAVRRSPRRAGDGLSFRRTRDGAMAGDERPERFRITDRACWLHRGLHVRRFKGSVAVKPSICFVTPNGYAVLSGDSSVRHIGGAEMQQALLARELARRGYRVSFVVLDHGQDDGIDLDGIRVLKA